MSDERDIIQRIPSLIISSSWSARVSTTRISQRGASALSFEVLTQSLQFGPVF